MLDLEVPWLPIEDVLPEGLRDPPTALLASASNDRPDSVAFDAPRCEMAPTVARRWARAGERR